MKNQTLIFEKNGMHMMQKCGTGYAISKENVISMMEKCGWKLRKVLG